MRVGQKAQVIRRLREVGMAGTEIKGIIRMQFKKRQI
jgi:hypothetical protein